MQVSWISFGSPIRRADGSITSNLASLRYRVLSPIRELDPARYSHQLTAVSETTPENLKDKALQADIVVFSKSFLPSNEALAERAKSLGGRVIFDVCDDHYRHPSFGPHYQRMSALADQMVCSTAEMAKVARAYSSGEPVVIADPYEGPSGTPAFSPEEPLRLLWFGHPSNLDSLEAALGDLIGYASSQPIALTVLTQLTDAITDGCRQVSARHVGRFVMSARPWSLDAQWRELAACDAVIIPTLNASEKRVKSANRMVEALWAGRPVVAQPLPAYLDFERWAPTHPTLSEGCRWLAANLKDVPGLISQAKSYIEERHAPAALAREWARVLEAQYALRTAA
ncbi:hypothetical protein [Phenylobacterium sp.]|uniref:hypothetical protein n=1 Tax=Phenylobacterium sp. TaxID=1871053 RepID=UPI00356A63CB